MLGTTGRTMQSDGCLLTILTAKLNYHGILMDPKQVLGVLKNAGGIGASGDLFWPAITKAFPTVYFHWRASTVLEERGNVAYREETDAALGRIYKLLLLGQPVPIRTVTKQGYGHWVLAVDGEGTDDLLIMDPIDGQMRRFSEKYGPMKDNLYAYATVLGSPNGKADRVPDEVVKQAIMGAGQGLYAIANKEPLTEVVDKFI